ncbi:hypothetical protein V8C86DRAFT_1163925 [Haematococcus lacustris]
MLMFHTFLHNLLSPREYWLNCMCMVSYCCYDLSAGLGGLEVYKIVGCVQVIQAWFFDHLFFNTGFLQVCAALIFVLCLEGMGGRMAVALDVDTYLAALGCMLDWHECLCARFLSSRRTCDTGGSLALFFSGRTDHGLFISPDSCFGTVFD